jgi:hypothetical protein
MLDRKPKGIAPISIATRVAAKNPKERFCILCKSCAKLDDDGSSATTNAFSRFSGETLGMKNTASF